MRLNIFSPFLILLTAAVFMFSCHSEKRSHPDSSDIQVSFDILTMYKDLAEVDTTNISLGMEKMKEKYGDFFDFYWKVIMQVNTPEDSRSHEKLTGIFTHPDYRHLLDTVNQVYKNHSDIDAALNQLFRNIRYYDSTLLLPEKVIYINSFLQSPAFTWDNVLGIGFDMFFGETFWPYESETVGIPKYISRHNIRKNIPVAAGKVLYSQAYPFNEEDKTLLELMILNGKNILFLDHVLPDNSMADLLGYTDAQWTWCEENEKTIYHFLTSNNLMYERNPVKIMRYIAPSPTSMGMPEESPGRTAIYIGYKIMKKYQEQTGKPLSDILKENIDAQKILKISNYKPTS